MDTDMTDSATGFGQPGLNKYGLSRREILLGMGTAAALAAAGEAAAAMPGHDHSQHATRFTDLLDATGDCLEAAQRCIAH